MGRGRPDVHCLTFHEEIDLVDNVKGVYVKKLSCISRRMEGSSPKSSCNLRWLAEYIVHLFSFLMIKFRVLLIMKEIMLLLLRSVTGER